MTSTINSSMQPNNTVGSTHTRSSSSPVFSKAKKQTDNILTLIVNGIPTFHFKKKSEIPAKTGCESWIVINSMGKTVDSYFPI